MMMRVRYLQAGGHFHCRVFTSKNGTTFAKCGNLVFDEKEWPTVRDTLLMSGIQVLDERSHLTETHHVFVRGRGTKRRIGPNQNRRRAGKFYKASNPRAWTRACTLARQR